MRKRIPHYPNFLRLPKVYREVSEWHGKEMLNLVHIILPALARALDNPPPAQRYQFQEAFTCHDPIVKWVLMADDHSHTQKKLDYFKQYRREFHCSRYVILVY